ncbi:ribokinase [Nocardia seriolae]|uniref:Ribokinase n=1 Tax=Nocardia seriolae TaxID=37332 RepID=A0A0B8N195_9NOCA|nr:ribokinase [Nocardia seriolae]APB00799.1 Sulfofructose kinase [Nocardia seriolae]MTJ65357.1 ribokinase [Nocardia seriolae]MTJ71876.1 ribokinase [Nocardia seriolae]MTJ90243.1 ribokinase [Nocardia seriolae]MTK34206.1 ribokinase [Nocardia seriolae]
MARIAVVGSINMDLVTTVGRRPDAGETVSGEGFALVPGGKGSNQAIAARRAGATVDFVGAVGSDVFADALRKVLREADIGTSRLRTVDGPSGIATIVVDGSGENTIIVVAGANGRLTELAAADLDAIAAADVLMCQLEIPIPTVATAARHARANDTVVLLNPSPVQELPDELWSDIDVAVVNEGEAARLDAALAAVPHVITTLGAAGAAYRGPAGHTLSHPGVPVEVVDTTGAGDSFTGALAAHWHEGPRTALAWACTAGALATTKLGASASIPEAAEIRRALAAAGRR